MGLKEIAAVFHISRNSTRKYVRLFQSSGKSMEELLAMTEEQLRQELGQEKGRHSKPSERETELEALLPEYAKRLTRKGMSKARLYEQYHAAYPDGYGLTMFKQALRQYLHQSKVVGHVEHYAGDQMYIDFAGDRLEVVDCMTGETKKKQRCSSRYCLSVITLTVRPYGPSARRISSKDARAPCNTSGAFLPR